MCYLHMDGAKGRRVHGAVRPLCHAGDRKHSRRDALLPTSTPSGCGHSPGLGLGLRPRPRAYGAEPSYAGYELLHVHGSVEQCAHRGADNDPMIRVDTTDEDEARATNGGRRLHQSYRSHQQTARGGPRSSRFPLAAWQDAVGLSAGTQ